MTDTNTPDDQLPEALIDELKRRDRAPDVITSRVDRSVGCCPARTLRSAPRAALEAPRRLGRRGGLRGAGRGAVDELSLGAGRCPPSTGMPTVPGQIDIADVLALAREGAPQTELDAFALRVVALDRDGGR